MNPYEQFAQERKAEIARQGADPEMRRLTREWFGHANALRYSYHVEWLGRPIIQYPQDIIAMQELIWSVKPDLIVETGIAHGGSIIFSASMLELCAACGGPADAEVVAIDIDIRPHNRAAIEAHPMSRRITLLEGSSVAPGIVAQVKDKARGKQRVLVALDSNHTHDHVLAELQAFAPMTTAGSYCIVFDTIIEELPSSPDRPWSRGNSPHTAIQQYIAEHPEFVVDTGMDDKLLISVAPGGFLKRVR